MVRKRISKNLYRYKQKVGWKNILLKLNRTSVAVLHVLEPNLSFFFFKLTFFLEQKCMCFSFYNISENLNIFPGIPGKIEFFYQILLVFLLKLSKKFSLCILSCTYRCLLYRLMNIVFPTFCLEHVVFHYMENPFLGLSPLMGILFTSFCFYKYCSSDLSSYVFECLQNVYKRFT